MVTAWDAALYYVLSGRWTWGSLAWLSQKWWMYCIAMVLVMIHSSIMVLVIIKIATLVRIVILCMNTIYILN